MIGLARTATRQWAASVPPELVVNTITRRRGLAGTIPMRPDWTFFYDYKLRLKLPPVVWHFPLRSRFQEAEINRSSFILPGLLEPWLGRIPRFSGMWSRAGVPLIPRPADAVMNPAPRFPWVWRVPMPMYAPASHPITSTGS
jgi:hypothetical protein